MKDILNKLLESELLSEESKAEITEAFESGVQQLEESLREEVTVEVKSQLVTEWVEQRDALIEAIDQQVGEMVSDEMAELKEDIERFRDLEAEYASKIVEEKEKLAEQFDGALDQLVVKLDAFLEHRIDNEFDELKEDLQEAKEKEYGAKIYEAFAKMFIDNVDEESVFGKLRIAESKIAELDEKVNLVESEKQKITHEKVLNETLAPLSGSKREQMKHLLEGVKTDRLKETYNRYISKIVSESTAEPVIDKEKQKVTEGKVKQSKVITGDKPTSKVVESKSTEDKELERWLSISGVKNS